MNGIWLLFLLGRWSMVQGWVDLVRPNRPREFVSVDARLDDLKKDTRSYEMLSRDNAVAGTSVFDGSGPAGVHSTATRGSGIHALSPLSPMSPMTPVMLSTEGKEHDAEAASREITKVTSFSSSTGTASIPSGRMTPMTSAYAVSAQVGASGGSPPPGRATPTLPPHGRRTPDYFASTTARYKAPARSFSNPRPPTASSTSGSWWPAAGGRPESPASFREETAPPPRAHARFASGDDYNYDYENRHPLEMNRI